MNPVDDRAFTQPLIRTLQRHVAAIADGVTGLPGLRTSAERLDEARQVAVPWVYLSVLVVWAEDHGLIRPWLRADAPMRGRFLAEDSRGAAGYLALAAHDLARQHPSTWALLDPRYTRIRDGRLPEGPVRELLDWWAADAPHLRYEVDAGPGSLSGWLPGDLLQHVSEGRRKSNALVQTPWWVADFILNQTLRPALDEFAAEPVIRLVDPCAGTGHFLVRAVDQLWDWYTTGTVPADGQGGQEVTGGVPVPPAVAARRILDGLHGCELDPLTAAVARLRVTVAVAAKLRPVGLRLDQIPHSMRPGIVVGDSLLLGKIPRAEYAELYPVLAEIVADEAPLFGAVRWPEDDAPAEPEPHAAVRQDLAGEQMSLLDIA